MKTILIKNCERCPYIKKRKGLFYCTNPETKNAELVNISIVAPFCALDNENRKSSDKITIVLDGERPLSWNKFYSGIHWSKRKKLADTVHELVKYSTLSQVENPVLFQKPVTIEFETYMTGKLIDPDNVCTKLYIDGLCGVLIKDDTPQYIKQVSSSVIKSQRPRVEIKIYD